ncbi:MAG: hypothetical protein SOZ59_15535 [Candidatus Limivivens sp.]|nr:hypothetical protein [Candidatus Limivivens sp.]
MEQEIDIRPYLEDLERRINPEEEIRLEQAWIRFADGKCEEEVFVPGRKQVQPLLSWPHIMVNDAMKSSELMILQQLATCSENLRTGGGELLSIRSNYGTGIIPTMLGAECFYMPYETDTLPGSRPFPGGKEDLFRVMEKKWDYSKGLAGKVFEMAERYLELTEAYPNIRRFVNYYNPDLQGPLPLAEMTWGSDIYADMYEEEEEVEQALDFFTDLYLDFSGKWKALCPDFDQEHSVEWGLLHRGGTIIRNDAAMNISGEMYAELVRPRDQRIIDAFGGCIHFCGRGHHYIEKVSEIRGISGINMSQPDWNDMEVIYRNTIDKGLIIIGMPEPEVVRAREAGRPLHGLVHCGASIAAWEKKSDVGR